MSELTLRNPENATQWPLHEGVHGVVRDAHGLHAVADATDAPVRFCVDRRGVWLTVGEGAGNVHVNGRRVRRMAMLRVGDAIYIDGGEVLLTRPEPPQVPDRAALDDVDGASGDLRVILRGVGGKHHGRSFTLDRPRLIGSAAEADVRIDDAAFAERHAQLLLRDDAIVLRDLGSAEGSLLNGHPVRDALLQPGDQLVFDAHHRFVIEAPGRQLRRDEPVLHFDAQARDAATADERGRTTWRRWPWLLLAALLIAASLAALLMFGTSR